MRFQSHHKTKDGRVFPVEITANYVEYNGVGYNCAFVRDIADRKKAEAALLESEEKYRTIFHSGSQGFFLMTDVFLDCNQQVCDIWGCTRDEVIGHSPVEFSPDLQPDGRTSEEAAKAYIDAAFAGEPQRFYWQHKRKDGTLVDTEITLDLLELKDQPLLQATMIDLSGHETTPPDAG